jgi:hypothetical protein
MGERTILGEGGAKKSEKRDTGAVTGEEKAIDEL